MSAVKSKRPTVSPKRRPAPKPETPQRKVHQSEWNVKLKEVQEAKLWAKEAQQAFLETQKKVRKVKREIAAAREAIRKKGNRRDNEVRKNKKARLEACHNTLSFSWLGGGSLRWESKVGV